MVNPIDVNPMLQVLADFLCYFTMMSCSYCCVRVNFFYFFYESKGELLAASLNLPSKSIILREIIFNMTCIMYILL